MFILKDVLPNPMLREYVQKHKIIRFTFEKNTDIPFKAYYPRPEQCLIFYLRDLGKISYASNQKIVTDPKCSISGQATGIIIDAEAIWGKEIRAAHEQMSNSDDVDVAIKIAETFLEKMVQKSKINYLGIDKASKLILCQNQHISISKMADEACLCIRQFNRKFNERVGVNPKTFDRLVRFNNAFRIKNAQPTLDWLSIALASGYYDYSHLAKDYKEFTHLTPTGLFDADTKAPERIFGVIEIN
jgi:AraC-like DNA-binding protein